MAGIGKPVRRHTVVPLENPVEPERAPSRPPSQPFEPAKPARTPEPEEVPA
jgi:hypothetical protein